MNKSQWMCVTLAIALTATSYSATAQSHLFSTNSSKQIRRPPTNPRGDGSPGGGQAKPMPRNPRGPGRPGGGRLYDDILNQIQREIPARVRGTEAVCAIAPNVPIQNGENIIWSDRPLFIWQGAAQKIELFAAGTNKPVWTKQLNSSDRIATYNGTPLVSGRRYEWRLYVSENDFVRRPFRIMASAERDTISAELNALEAELKSQGATPEEITLERANNFVKRRLYSDALREIYGFPNPSSELTKLAQDISKFICN